jgi:hypothetical protein
MLTGFITQANIISYVTTLPHNQLGELAQVFRAN